MSLWDLYLIILKKKIKQIPPCITAKAVAVTVCHDSQPLPAVIRGHVFIYIFPMAITIYPYYVYLRPFPRGVFRFPISHAGRDGLAAMSPN